MSQRHGWISAFIAVPGVLACVFAVVGFLRKIIANGLPFRSGLSASEHYQAVGQAYGDGFLTGFFFCFFLVLAVLALGVLVVRPQRPRLLRRKEDSARPIVFPGNPA